MFGINKQREMMLLKIVTLSWLLPLITAQSVGGDVFKHERFLNPGAVGPWVKATKGEVWPKPKVVKYRGSNYSVVEPNNFMFKVTYETLNVKFVTKEMCPL